MAFTSRLGVANARLGNLPLGARSSGVGGATAVTLSGPSVGAVSVASTNFTVGANGTITGTVTVTPSDGGAGGTFTPATVNISSGTPTATFTYTPASTGAKTISVTNNGSLTNPSNLTYTVFAAATTYTFTGPSTGTTNSASTNFTVALPASTVVSSAVTVTPASTNGSFSPASVIFPANTVAPSVTFTYTPTTDGAHTLSVTNSGVLTNPPNLTYTSSTPADSTLMLQADASTIAGVDGAAVSAWADSSGNNNNFSQVTGVSQPVLKLGVNGINSQAAIQVSGSQYMATASWLSSVFDTSFYAEMVIQRTSGTTEVTVLSIGADLLRVTIQGADAVAKQNLTSNVPGPLVKAYMPSGMSPGPFSSGADLVCSSRVTGSADRIVLQVQYDGSHVRLGVNGLWNQIHYPLANIAAASGSAMGNLGLTGAVTIGANASGANGFTGLISHLAVYKSAKDYTFLKSRGSVLRQTFGVIPQKLYFAVGDSTTAGQGLSAGQDYVSQMLVVTPALTGNYDVVNQGVGGSNSTNWLQLYQFERVIFGGATDRAQQVAGVMGFGNDATTGIASYSTADEGRVLYLSHRQMCDALKKEGVQVIACTILPRASTTGTAQAGGASTITLASGASATDSFYNGLSIGITAGTGAGQERTISSYVGATKVATVSSVWTTQPDATSVYAIGPIVATDRILAANVHIRTHYADYADALCDLANDANLSDPANPTYFQDGTHPTAAGATRIAQLINGVINGLGLPVGSGGGRRRFQ